MPAPGDINVVVIPQNYKSDNALVKANNSAVANKNLHVIYASDPKDLATQLEQLKNNQNNIKNLYIESHGGLYDAFFSIGSEKINADAVYNHEESFKRIGNAMSKDGNIILMACLVANQGLNGGKDVLPMFAKAVNRTVYGNQGETPGASYSGTPLAMFPYGQTYYNLTAQFNGTGSWSKAIPNNDKMISMGTMIIKPDGNFAFTTSWLDKNKVVFEYLRKNPYKSFYTDTHRKLLLTH